MDGTRAQEEQPVAVKPEALDAAKEQKRRDEEQLSAAQRVWRFVKRAFEFVFIEQWCAPVALRRLRFVHSLTFACDPCSSQVPRRNRRCDRPCVGAAIQQRRV